MWKCRAPLFVLVAFAFGMADEALANGSGVFDTFAPLPGRDFYRPTPSSHPYSTRVFLSHVRDIAFEVAVINTGVMVVGIRNWRWGSSKFHFRSEGWFGRHTGSGGVDKLGHAFSGAILTDFYTDRIRQVAHRPEHAALTAGILSLGTMTGIEIFDGFSGDHGFSWEDMAANGAGIAFSMLRNAVPGMRELVDFRQEYFPRSYEKGFHPLLNYESKRFLVAFKLSGAERFENTPLRFLELQVGYHARGFSRAARLAGVRKRRRLYIGIGINLNRTLFGEYRKGESMWRWGGRFLLEHQQVPFTSFGTSTRDFYRRR